MAGLVELRDFFRKQPQWLLFFGVVVGWRYWAAATVPLGNDEVYYWDWARDLQWSYFDHPGGVAWIAALASWLVEAGNLGGRLFLPIFHMGSSLILYLICRQLLGRPLNGLQLGMVFLITQLAPMNLSAILLLPDVGLYFFFGLFLLVLLQQVDKPKLSMISGLLLGLLAGFSVCQKYHAGFMGMTGLLAVLWLRRDRFRSDLPGWIFLLGGGVIGCAPLLIWNLQHDLVSLRYQTNHGFASPSFHLSWGLRIPLALLIIGTPLLVINWIKGISSQVWSSRAVVIAAATLPLMAMFLGLSFFKEVLPHWLLPSLWFSSPFVLMVRVNKFQIALHGFYGLGLAMLLTLTLGVERNRLLLNDEFKQRPGGLGELTLWEDLGEAIEESQPEWPKITGKDSGDDCPDEPLWAGSRWFWTAQLAWVLPRHPKVINLDINHVSFYSFRDQNKSWQGCPVYLVTSPKHFNQQEMAAWFDVQWLRPLVVKTHLDREVVIVGGVLTKPIGELTRNILRYDKQLVL